MVWFDNNYIDQLVEIEGQEQECRKGVGSLIYPTIDKSLIEVLDASEG